MPLSRMHLRGRPDGPTPVPRRRRPGWRHPVVQFLAAGLVALLVIIVGSGWLSRRAATDEAVLDARHTAWLLSQSVIEPSLSNALVNENWAAVDRFDRLVRERVMGDDVLRVKVWDRDGRIVYSDKTELIGRHFELGAEELEILAEGGTDAEPSDPAWLTSRGGPEYRFLSYVRA